MYKYRGITVFVCCVCMLACVVSKVIHARASSLIQVWCYSCKTGMYGR